MKKLLSLVLVLTVVLSSMSFAFAAVDPTVVSGGIDNSDVKSAVERLSGLGLVAGMEDGKYHPELKVTREQAAKLIVEALGLGAAAEAAKGATPFADVAADRWSSGYVNVAVGQGIIKGMGDGTFAPAAEVTYAQVITMVVRALGYTDDFLKGVWPGNYVAKAAALSLTKKVTFSPAGTADRGSVAVMINNALDTNVIVQKTYGSDNNWEVSNTTLLQEKLQLAKSAKVRVTDVPRTSDSLKADEIICAGFNGGDPVKVLQTGLDVNSLLNKEVTLYTDDDDVKYVAVETSASNVVVGMISEVNEDTTNKIKVKANGTETEYSLTDDVTATINNVNGSDEFDNAQVADDDADLLGLYGTFVKNGDGKIEYADVYSFDNSPMVVKSVDAANKTMKAYEDDASTATKQTLNDDVKVFGAVSKLEDIKANDVVYIKNDMPEISDDEYSYVLVVRNVVTGKLTKSNTAGDELTIAGKKYNVDAEATVSLDEGSKIDELTGVASFDGAVGKDVTALLDVKGEIRYLVTKTTSTNLIYGIVKGVFETDTVKVYLPATDTTATYSFDADDYTNLYAIKASLLNQPVVLTLDTDGKLDKLYVINALVDGDGNPVVVANAEADIDSMKDGYTVDTVTLDAADDADLNADTNSINVVVGPELVKYTIRTSTVLVDADATDAPEAVKWADIEEKALPNTDNGDDAITAQIVLDADGKVTFVAFTENFSLGSDFEYAVVTDRFVDDEQRATLSVDGKETTVELGDDATGIEKGDIIFYSTDADGKVINVTRAVYGNVFATDAADVEVDGQDSKFDVVTGIVSDFEDGVVTFAADGFDTTLAGAVAREYTIPEDVKVWLLTYDEDSTDSIEATTASEINEDAEVSLVLNDDGDVVLVIVKESV